MSINQGAAEQAAELSALRAMVQTVAMLTFESHGFTADKVRMLGRHLAAQISGLEVAGAAEADLQFIREANSQAYVALFDAVADGMSGQAGEREE
ncbi:hypothetical protein [Methylobacterium sp. Leaf118]|uniref:hypothetical protein n=1 Tax=Methylobacterium sp. Leaf118 TaxID=2876562 RepID=UPI001E435C7C|nr:hypothetical protein [Methylobacterium sp. Leaf118]